MILLLSLMVFITSSGLTVNLHYCAGKLQQVSLQQDQKDCLMKMNTVIKNCESKTSNIKSYSNCCQNHQIIAKADTKITKAKEDNILVKSYAVLKTYFISLFSFSLEGEYNSDDSNSENSLFPILKEGLYILLQNFRD
nr:hypothetical protein [Pseudopedobacter sp.]